MTDPTMTKAERDQLLQLVRKREKVMKHQAQERTSALLAEFDAQSAKIHHFDDEPVWAQAEAHARKAIEEANEAIAKRCKEMGIPEEFAPGVNFFWSGRGHNAVAERRAELRRAAKSKIEALEKEAVAKIERMGLEAQTEIIAHGLQSDAAKAFLENMPKLEALMPPVEITEVQNLIEARRRERRLSYNEYN